MTEFERVIALMCKGFEAMEAETPVGENEDELEKFRATLVNWQAAGDLPVHEPTAERPVPTSYNNFR